MSYSKQQSIVHHNEGAGSTRRENRGRAEQRKYNKVSKKELSAREIKQITRMMDSRIQLMMNEESDPAIPETAYRPSKQELRNMAKYKRNRQAQKYEKTIAVFANEEEADASDTVFVKQQKLNDEWPDCWNWSHSYEEDEFGLVPMHM